MRKHNTGHCKAAWALATMGALVCCLSGAQRAASAQQPPSKLPSTPSPAWQTAHIHIQTQGKPLSYVVALLARQLHCNIVMDDAPLLPPPDLDCEGTGKEVMDKVCDAYDYSWRVGRQGMTLLSKRFYNPDELPQMSLPELQQMGRDALTALAGVTCDPRVTGWAYGCKTLYEGCTPAQLETLKQGSPLRYAELSAAQQETLAQMLLNRRFAEIILSAKMLSETFDLVPASLVQARDPAPLWRNKDMPFDIAPVTPVSTARQELLWLAQRKDRTVVNRWLKTLHP